MEAAPRLDGCADDDELCAALRRDACNFFPETSGPGADDLPPHADAVGADHPGRPVEPLLEAHKLPLQVRVERQLPLEDCRRDEHDSRPAIGREPARKVERMLRLLPIEQRHDDALVGDRARPAREALRPAVEQPDVGESHRRSW